MEELVVVEVEVGERIFLGRKYQPGERYSELFCDLNQLPGIALSLGGRLTVDRDTNCCHANLLIAPSLEGPAYWMLTKFSPPYESIPAVIPARIPSWFAEFSSSID